MDKINAYRILKNRLNNENYKYLFETDNSVEISHLKNPKSAIPFFGSWTNIPQDFENDKDIQILVSALPFKYYNKKKNISL